MASGTLRGTLRRYAPHPSAPARCGSWITLLAAPATPLRKLSRPARPAWSHANGGSRKPNTWLRDGEGCGKALLRVLRVFCAIQVFEKLETHMTRAPILLQRGDPPAVGRARSRIRHARFGETGQPTSWCNDSTLLFSGFPLLKPSRRGPRP